MKRAMEDSEFGNAPLGEAKKPCTTAEQGSVKQYLGGPVDFR